MIVVLTVTISISNYYLRNHWTLQVRVSIRQKIDLCLPRPIDGLIDFLML